MKVEIKETFQVPAFKPVQVVLNFDNKEDFMMLLDIVGYNESIPKMITDRSADTNERDSVYNHCQHLLTCIHRAMRDYLV
jgi:hypothetical protein